MPTKDYIPRGESLFRAFARNFFAQVSADPEALGLLPADASALAAELERFEAAFFAAFDASTRTRAKITVKASCRASLERLLRSLAQRVQKHPSTTSEQRINLGLRVADTNPSPAGAPATKPALFVQRIDCLRNFLRIRDSATPSRRAQPPDTIGAEIYAWIGPGIAPESLEQWQYKGLATRDRFEIHYSPADAGKPVVLVARWSNRRGQTGPTSNPIRGIAAA